MSYTSYMEKHLYTPKSWTFIIEKNNNIVSQKCFVSISFQNYKWISTKRIESVLEWNLDNPLVWSFSVTFNLKGSSKCTNHVNINKLYAVEYINTVCSLDYPFQFRIFESCQINFIKWIRWIKNICLTVFLFFQCF